MTDVEDQFTAASGTVIEEAQDDIGEARSILAGLAPTTRRIGNGGRILGSVVLVVVAGLVAAGEVEPTVGTFVAPVVIFGLGQLLCAAARRMREGTVPRLPTLVGYVFIAAGAAMLIGDGILVVDDPAGFALMAFGLVFVGAGVLAQRLFTAPEGKRAVHVSGYEADIRKVDGRRGTRRQASVIYVDEDATEEEVEGAKDDWLRAQWERRPDWVTGRISSEDERGGGLLRLAVGVWSVFALSAVAAAVFWDGFFRNVAAAATLVAGALIVRAVRRTLRLRKFGTSHLALAHTPAFLGGVLEGDVESGVAADAARPSGFHVRLRCVHRWEETTRRGSSDTRRTYHRREVLWEDERRTAGRATDDGNLSVPVTFRLPADRPAGTPARSGEGISWEVEVKAEMEGVDYHARFEVPVFAKGQEPWSTAPSP